MGGGQKGIQKGGQKGNLPWAPHLREGGKSTIETKSKNHYFWGDPTENFAQSTQNCLGDPRSLKWAVGPSLALTCEEMTI